MTKGIEKIKNYLTQNENIIFALLFGSLAEGGFKHLSDVDIGIYLKHEPDLLEMGRMISDLEKIAGRSIDLVVLNNLFKKDPLFAYEIISKSKPLFSKDDRRFTEFKRRVFLAYLDTEALRKEVNQSLLRRIDENRFGRFNYA